ncbi:hypothetical protein ACGF0J_09535 [Nonomuraea sp. NPDC047897]|uniref:hypothetical protein n=1 Tax=Nonomuraea sp. NPDC047897 TaxID=3364346 RepID=UPI0037223703
MNVNTSRQTSFAGWVGDRGRALETLDFQLPVDDLEPLRDIVGDARVVALGESSHHIREFYRVRHRILRFLVERCGSRCTPWKPRSPRARSWTAGSAAAPAPWSRSQQTVSPCHWDDAGKCMRCSTLVSRTCSPAR